MIKYKIKLQMGDHLKIADITKNQYQGVVDRFYGDSGLPRTSSDYFDYGVDVSDYEFIGWAVNNVIDVGDENNMDGRLLTYSQIMEQEQMSNEWFEKGELPPVGLSAMISLDKEFKSDFPNEFAMYNSKEVEIIAHSKSMHNDKKVALFGLMIDGQPNYHAFVAEVFKPIRTERERAIESALKIYRDMEDSNFKYEDEEEKIESLLKNWFDAGLLRAPEDK